HRWGHCWERVGGASGRTAGRNLRVSLLGTDHQGTDLMGADGGCTDKGCTDNQGTDRVDGPCLDRHLPALLSSRAVSIRRGLPITDISCLCYDQ
ncbi:unnamed protein product, partial [Staurois parvus]